MLVDGDNEVGKYVQFSFEQICVLLAVLIKISNILKFNMKSGCAFLTVQLWKGKMQSKFSTRCRKTSVAIRPEVREFILKLQLVGILYSESLSGTQVTGSACPLLHSRVLRIHTPAAVAWEYLTRVCQRLDQSFNLFRRAKENLKCQVTLKNHQVRSHGNAHNWPVPRRKDGILHPQQQPTNTAVLTSWGNAANLRIRQ